VLSFITIAQLKVKHKMLLDGELNNRMNCAHAQQMELFANHITLWQQVTFWPLIWIWHELLTIWRHVNVMKERHYSIF